MNRKSSVVTALALSLFLAAGPVQAADTEALKEKAAELAEQTSETASELGSSLKAWGSKAWETGVEAAGVAKEKLAESEDSEVGETLKGIGSSLMEGGKRAADAAKEKMDELRREREADEAPEVEGIAI